MLVPWRVCIYVYIYIPRGGWFSKFLANSFEVNHLAKAQRTTSKNKSKRGFKFDRNLEEGTPKFSGILHLGVKFEPHFPPQTDPEM